MSRTTTPGEKDCHVRFGAAHRLLLYGYSPLLRAAHGGIGIENLGTFTVNETQSAITETPPTIDVLYRELKRLAHNLRARGEGHTLSTTVLVHEVWLKLGSTLYSTNDRPHFLRLAAKAMRQIIVDNARAHGRDKRDGIKVELIEAEALPDATPEQTISLDHALVELEAENVELAQIAELHLFAGFNFAEIAALVDRSERTVYRDWRTVRMYLGRALFGAVA